MRVHMQVLLARWLLCIAYSASVSLVRSPWLGWWLSSRHCKCEYSIGLHLVGLYGKTLSLKRAQVDTCKRQSICFGTEEGRGAEGVIGVLGHVSLHPVMQLAGTCMLRCVLMGGSTVPSVL